VEAASEKQAEDIILLDLRNISSFADYFVICTAGSSHQVQAVCEEIELRLSREGVRLLHSEGTFDSGWILLDYGTTVVHIFSPEEREYYQLEKMWYNANLVVRIQ